MKQLLILLVLMVSGEVSAEVFTVAGSVKKFAAQDGLLVGDCKDQCEALKTVERFRQIDLKKVRQGMSFVNSVGSDVCARVYEMGSVLGVAANRDRRAFCVFKDGSMLEMNSLSAYLSTKNYLKD